MNTSTPETVKTPRGTFHVINQRPEGAKRLGLWFEHGEWRIVTDGENHAFAVHADTWNTMRESR